MAYYITNLGLGFSVASLGPTLPGLASQTASALGAVSILFAVRAVGRILSNFVAGRAYDRVAGHPLLGTAMIGIALMMALTSFMPVLWALAIVFFVMGMAEGFIDVGVNAMLVWTHKGRAGPFINGLHFMFGLGAFIAPLIISQVIVIVNGASISAQAAFMTPFEVLSSVLIPAPVAWPYRVLALTLLPIGFLIWSLRSPQRPQQTQPADTAPVVVRWGLVFLFALMLAVYVGAEASYSGWVYTYALERKLMGEAQAALLVSLFWGMVMIGRLAGVAIALRVKPRYMLLGALIGSLLSTLAMIAVPTATMLWIGTIAFGLSMAPIFPTVVAFADKNLEINGKITSYFFIGASVGAIVLPWLIGQLFRPVGPEALLYLILASVIVLSGVYTVLVRAVTVQ
ncbi:MAG: MFS transporter [Chloroflexota bacterium]